MQLNAEGLSKRYFRKTGEANFFEAVKRVDFSLRPGRVTLLMGRSGSGKTTLLHMMAGLLKPSEGRVTLGETDLYALDDAPLSRLRNERIAVVPQARSAVETLTVRENLLLPGLLGGGKEDEAAAQRWMERLGIASLADSRPKELSGGELRRMAIARAMMRSPEVLMADEPTGDLDDENTALVLGLLREAAGNGAAVLIVSHEAEALAYADEAFRMDAGVLTAMEGYETGGKMTGDTEP